MAQVIRENSTDAHDYPAASSYLSLLVADDELRTNLLGRLQAAPVSHYKAKDLLRASQLALLTPDNVHVAADLRKIRKSRPLSPVLLVRGDLLRGFPLEIADGYHRICASYYVNENTDIPCRMIDLPAALRARAAKQMAPVAAKKAAPAKKSAPVKVTAKKSAVKKATARKTIAKKATPAPATEVFPASESHSAQ